MTGIGNAIAKALAAGGAVTFALDIIQENLDKLKSEVRSFNLIHLYLLCNLNRSHMLVDHQTELY